MENMAESQEGSWRSQSFRQNVRSKIEEAIRMSGNPTTKSVPEMENHVFQKAKTREEYLGYVARLIIHVREMSGNVRRESEASSSSEECPKRSDTLVATAECYYDKLIDSFSAPLPIEREEEQMGEASQIKRPHFQALAGGFDFGCKRMRPSNVSGIPDNVVVTTRSTSRRILHERRREMTLHSLLQKEKEQKLKVKLLLSQLKVSDLKEKLLKAQMEESDLKRKVLQKQLEYLQKLSVAPGREISLDSE